MYLKPVLFYFQARFGLLDPIKMNITTALDAVGGVDLGFGMDLEETSNLTLARNLTSIYFAVKSNNSELADCSQNILMDEIKVSGFF